MTRPPARLGTFNPRAPLTLVEEREIGAPPRRVWSVLTAVGRWPAWHRGIDFAALRGPLSRGTALHWRADGMRIASYVAEVEEGRTVGWTIRTLGAHGYQRWTLEGSATGGTRLRLEESWDGLIVRFLRGTLRRTLVRSRSEWFRGIDRASAGPGGSA